MRVALLAVLVVLLGAGCWVVVGLEDREAGCTAGSSQLGSCRLIEK